MKRLLIAAALFAATSAHAMTGNELYADLTSKGAIGRVAGTAYINGVVDGAESAGAIECKSGLTFGQIRDVVQRGLENAPELRHYSARSLVLLAVEAFELCKPVKKAAPKGEQRV